MKLSRSQMVDNPEYFQALLDNKILLLPFTVDPFGGLGSYAHTFLYGSTPNKYSPPPAPPPPNWRSSLHLPHATTHFDQLQHIPTGLFPKATANYKPPPDTSPLANPLSPHRWAHHCLALNLSTSIANHIIRSITSARRSLYSPNTPTLTTLGVPFPYRVHTTFLDPLPYYIAHAGD
jgi:hypothetical protein